MEGLTGDDIYRVFTQGWDAAEKGRAEDTCPYARGGGPGRDPVEATKARLWLEGWQASHNNPAGAGRDANPAG